MSRTPGHSTTSSIRARRSLTFARSGHDVSVTFNLRFMVIVALLIIGAIGLMADSCDTSGGPQQQQANQNANATDKLHKVEPYPVMNNSQELHNQREWYLRLNDPNKVAYIYLITMDGKVFAEYQIIAKCSSTNSQYSTPYTVEHHSSTDGGNVAIPSSQPDGSYGTNENAVFCFLDDANRTMIEFSDQWHYVWSEQPLALTTPPTIVIVPNGK